MENSLRFSQAIAAFDAANQADPRRVQLDGEEVAYELLYARRLSAELAQFAPDASEYLQLAARAQHLERWQLPRDSYPMNREGYLAWRNELKLWHARRASELMAQVGYAPQEQARVASLIKKEKFKSDAEGQVLEDVVCLVFLRHYFAEFASQHSQEKIVDIVAKTWRKMSAAGQAAALTLPFTPEQLALLKLALTLE
ncbi:MAG: DUF4202 domain-containing protein [Aeromonadaceae bacterium]